MSEWISVNDEMPKIGKRVYLYIKECDFKYEVGSYDGKSWVYNACNHRCVPTHWRPVHKPQMLEELNNYLEKRIEHFGSVLDNCYKQPDKLTTLVTSELKARIHELKIIKVFMGCKEDKAREEYKTTDKIRHYNHSADSQVTLIDLMNKVEYLTGLVKHLTQIVKTRIPPRRNLQGEEIIE